MSSVGVSHQKSQRLPGVHTHIDYSWGGKDLEIALFTSSQLDKINLDGNLLPWRESLSAFKSQQQAFLSLQIMAAEECGDVTVTVHRPLQ